MAEEWLCFLHSSCRTLWCARDHVVSVCPRGQRITSECGQILMSPWKHQFSVLCRQVFKTESSQRDLRGDLRVHTRTGFLLTSTSHNRLTSQPSNSFSSCSRVLFTTFLHYRLLVINNLLSTSKRGQTPESRQSDGFISQGQVKDILIRITWISYISVKDKNDLTFAQGFFFHRHVKLYQTWSKLKQVLT